MALCVCCVFAWSSGWAHCPREQRTRMPRLLLARVGLPLHYACEEGHQNVAPLVLDSDIHADNSM
eukprot:120173-Rhodomonas_salina.2